MLETMHVELDAVSERARSERERADDLQRQVERLSGKARDLTATEELLERSRREAAAARQDAEDLRLRLREQSQAAADAQAEAAATAGELGSARATIAAVKAQLSQAQSEGASAQQAANQIYIALESSRALDAAVRAAAMASTDIRSASARDAAAAAANRTGPSFGSGSGSPSGLSLEDGSRSRGGSPSQAMVRSGVVPQGTRGDPSHAEGPLGDGAALRSAVRAAFAQTEASEVRLLEAESRSGHLAARVTSLEEQLGDSKRQCAAAVADQRRL